MSHGNDTPMYYDANDSEGVFEGYTFVRHGRVPKRCPKSLVAAVLYVVLGVDKNAPAIMITPDPEYHSFEMLIDEGTGTVIDSGGRQEMWELFLSHARML